MKSQQEYMKNVSTIYLFSQFLLNFPSMPFSSDLRMLISQQSSTTPVRPAESINTKTEVFFMRELRNTKIIAVDHGYGNMKTANTVTPTGIKAYETEPIFTGNILEYNGIYYRIGEGHKEFIPDKAMDEEYYLLTLMAIARELNVFSIREADVHLAAGLPLTWMNNNLDILDSQDISLKKQLEKDAAAFREEKFRPESEQYTELLDTRIQIRPDFRDKLIEQLKGTFGKYYDYHRRDIAANEVDYLNVEDSDVFSHRAWELKYQREQEMRRNQPARAKKKSYDMEL
jgi:hypothetical protein